MKPVIRYIALLCLAFVLETMFVIQAQTITESESKVINELMERWIENTESTVDYTDLQDQLEYYIKHKIDLNKTDRFELEQLLLLNDVNIDAILNHRKNFGDYASIYELQTIEMLDDRTLYYLSFFVKVGNDLYQDHTPLLKRIQKGKHEVLILRDADREQRAGYDPELRLQGKTHYTGSPERYVFRYRFNYTNKLSFGYTGEKDMGEPFIGEGKGFDFNSVHLIMRDIGKWKAIAVGDYQVNFGQGLTFGTGMSAGKSAYVLNVRKSFQPIRPYRSLNENEFLRGAATTYSLRKISFTLFGSHKKITTNLQTQTTITGPENAGSFSSIQVSGLHRTEAEITNKNNVQQRIAGGHIRYRHNGIELGFTTAGARYGRYFAKGNDPYQLYNFDGNELYGMGIDYGFQLMNTNFFGEVSRSNNGAFAGIIGLNTVLHPNLDMVMIYRNYSKRYRAIYNNPFGEYGDGKNEEGLYAGLSFKPVRKWLFNCYVDWYRSPWLRYLTDAPSRGTDYLTELQYNPNKRTQFYIRYRNERKDKNQSGDVSAIDFTGSNQRQQYRLNLQYMVTEQLSARTRFEYITFQEEKSGKQKGILLFQDLGYTTAKKKLSFNVRMALFSVDDYNARVYATEQDVLYQHTVPLYQNAGIRYYGVLHYKVNRHLDCWLKYSETQYSDVQTIGSGLEQIKGNRIRDLRLQLRISL